MNNPSHSSSPSSPLDRRIDYTQGALQEGDVAGIAPHDLLAQWLAQADEAGAPEPQAMTLATVDADGQPSARVVLLRGLSADGLIFFTNRESRKGRALAHEPRASLLFYWQTLERQVRVEGRVALLDDAASDAYYASRPLGSRVGAWASPQSQEIESRAWLEERVQSMGQQLGDAPQRPPFWGGYRLVAQHFEFWQGRSSRLHDRLAFERRPDGWRLSRLAP